MWSVQALPVWSKIEVMEEETHRTFRSRSTTTSFQSAHSSPWSSRAQTSRTTFSAESTLKQHLVRNPSSRLKMNGRATASSWVEATTRGQVKLQEQKRIVSGGAFASQKKVEERLTG